MWSSYWSKSTKKAARTTSSSSPEFPQLADAAIESVRQWQYKPYLLNGQPTEVETTVQLNFTLHRQ